MIRNLILPSIAGLSIVALVVFAYLHGADLRVLNPQGAVGLEERWVIVATFALSAIVVVPLFIALLVFALKYRAGNEKSHMTHEPNWDHDNWLAEFFWWLVPTAIIIVLSIIAWQTTHDLDPFKELPGAPSIPVDVIALDWKWLFIYPEQGIATVNMVEFPQNVPVHFYITSDAPMNSFWIPSLGGQIMAMPGMTTQMNLVANTTGNFNGFSSNISGDGFAGMAFTAQSVSAQDFSTWVAWVKQQQHPLTFDTYATLAKPSEYNPIAYYSSVEPNLFTANVMKYMMVIMQPTPSMPTPLIQAPASTTASTTTMASSTSATSSMQMQSMPDMKM